MTETMRRLITLCEARKKAAPISPSIAPPPPSHNAEAQALNAQVLQAAKIIQSELYGSPEFRTWDKSWIGEVKAVLAVMRKEHDHEQHEDQLYGGDDGEPAQMVPFVMTPDIMLSALSTWWQQKDGSAEVAVYGEAMHRLQEYGRDHPKVEMSDTITLLQDEMDFGRIVMSAGFGSLRDMARTVAAVLSYAESLRKLNYEPGYGDPSEPTRNIVCRGFPLILTVCKALA